MFLAGTVNCHHCLGMVCDAQQQQDCGHLECCRSLRDPDLVDDASPSLLDLMMNDDAPNVSRALVTSPRFFTRQR
ncbi:MAG: hypothetical protein ACHQT6_00760 [Candidatus Acidiferrales bacterium]